MSIEIQSVQRIRMWSESSFAFDGTGTLANYTDLPIREGSAQMTLTQDSLDPMQMVQSRVEYREEVLGKRSATLTFQMNLSPTGTAATNAVAAITSPLGRLLKAVMGAETLGTGTTFTGGTAVVPTVVSATGFSAGGAIGWVNSSGLLEVREIESISGNAITVKHAFSASPTSGNAIACATYSLSEDPQESLQFIVDGVESDDRWLLLGGQAVGGMQIAVDPTGAALPSVTFNFTFANWRTSAETTASLTGAIGTATYSAYEPIVGHAGEFRVFTVGASTLTTSSRVHVSALAFTPSIAYAPVTSPNGTNTVLRWRASRASPPCEGTFTTFYEDLTWFTGRANRTDYNVVYQMGIAAGQTVVLTAPTVQAINPQRAADASQLAAQTLQWKARRDTDVGSSTTALSRSPWRVHIF